MKESFKLFNDSIFEFQTQYYGHLLRHEHLAQKSQRHIPKFKIPGVEDAVVMDFWGYLLIKDGRNYLIWATDASGTEIDIDKLLPIEAHDIQKVADPRGEVYHLVRKPVPKRIEPHARLTPREIIDNLTLLEHSNPKQQKLVAMMALSQLWNRSYYRLATEPGFGKDSIVDTCGSFFGGCGTVESPTAAKLEDRATVLKWLVINEVVDIQKADWDIIQQFLLAAGAHKNEITKRSRAFQNVGEIINTSQFSLSLFYNDVIDYPDIKKYFDVTTKKAVKDRFPAFRFYGKFTEDFNAMKDIDLKAFVKKNMSFYTDMIESFLFYKNSYHGYLHNYDQSKLMKCNGRAQTNLGRLLKIVDLYCESQEEFDEWIEVINDARMDYVDMGGYPRLENAYRKKFGDDNIENMKEELAKHATFKQKNAKLKELIKADTGAPKKAKEGAVWDFNDKDIL